MLADDRPVIMPVGELPEVGTVLAEALAKHCRIGVRQLGNSRDAQCSQALTRVRTDARQALDGQWAQEVSLRARLDDEAAIRLREVTRQLGDGLGAADTHGNDESGLGQNTRFDLARDVFRAAAARDARRQLAVRLVNGDLLADEHILVHDGHDPRRKLAVALEAWPEEDCVGAEPAGERGGHGAVHAVAAGDVVGGADDAAAVGVAANGRLTMRPARTSGMAPYESGLETAEPATDDALVVGCRGQGSPVGKAN
jgi:hypothetical protein